MLLFIYGHLEKVSVLKSFYYYLDFTPQLINVGIYDKKFVLFKPVGMCAINLSSNSPSGADPLLYKSCFCCGDKYNPDPSLGCPANPWN
jgi:hypothetical protein